MLDEAGPRALIFAITMGNHGPWFGKEPAKSMLADIPQAAEFARYLEGLGRSDEMLRILIDGLEDRRSDAILGFYGDHLPSLPAAFAHLGFDDWRSDYAIWSSAGGPAIRCDLAAHELGGEVVADALEARQPLVFDGVVPEPHHA